MSGFHVTHLNEVPCSIFFKLVEFFLDGVGPLLGVEKRGKLLDVCSEAFIIKVTKSIIVSSFLSTEPEENIS